MPVILSAFKPPPRVPLYPDQIYTQSAGFTWLLTVLQSFVALLEEAHLWLWLLQRSCFQSLGGATGEAEGGHSLLG